MRSIPSKHALVQEAAYGSLCALPGSDCTARCRSTRDHSPELIDSQPEFFARHYSEAGLVERSVSIGARLLKGLSHVRQWPTAAAQFRKALGQLALLPDDAHVSARSSNLHVPWVPVLQAVKGFARRNRRRLPAHENCGNDGLLRRSSFISRGASRLLCDPRQFDWHWRMDKDLLRLRPPAQRSGQACSGPLSAGRTTDVYRRLVSSQSHLEAALALYDRASRASLVDSGWERPYVNAQAVLASVHSARLSRPGTGRAMRRSRVSEASVTNRLGCDLGIRRRLALFLGDNTALDERAAS